MRVCAEDDTTREEERETFAYRRPPIDQLLRVIVRIQQVFCVRVAIKYVFMKFNNKIFDLLSSSSPLQLHVFLRAWNGIFRSGSERSSKVASSSD